MGEPLALEETGVFAARRGLLVHRAWPAKLQADKASESGNQATEESAINYILNGSILLHV